MESRRLDIRFKDFEIAKLKHDAKTARRHFSDFVRNKLGLPNADRGGRPKQANGRQTRNA